MTTIEEYPRYYYNISENLWLNFQKKSEMILNCFAVKTVEYGIKYKITNFWNYDIHNNSQLSINNFNKFILDWVFFCGKKEVKKLLIILCLAIYASLYFLNFNYKAFK